ncbi:hypothetical protein EP47_08570 [Legionella norrlandica]|uniref:Uncharacterized protein n=1 Tax=Legionella norrlandica TaxID=1498499 RepID=A0A0A2SS76_9GAMM|nr:hypothetical protein [Legionella norrlandica]KGP63945.1 hypothetical protein EP47_08570 [Legionella norrlandica]
MRPTISEQQFMEIKKQLKEKQLVCNPIDRWKKSPVWLRDITSMPELPPDFINKLNEIRAAIISFRVDKNTLGLAVFYNELCKILAQPYNILEPIDTKMMENHVNLLDRIKGYASKVDMYIRSLSEWEPMQLHYREFWDLLNEVCRIEDAENREHAKEKFSQAIFSRLSQHNPKIYMDVKNRLEEFEFQQPCRMSLNN